MEDGRDGEPDGERVGGGLLTVGGGMARPSLGKPATEGSPLEAKQS